MAGHEIRLRKTDGFHGRERSNGRRQNRGLSVLSQLQLLSRSVETQLRQRKPYCFVCFFKDLSGRRKVFGQVFSHAWMLRSLPGKNERNAHRGTHPSSVLPPHA